VFIVGGFLLWLLNPIIGMFRQHSETGTVYLFSNYMWDGIVFIILILTGFWFIRKLKEWQEVRY